jgi:uncharacterized protein DUF4390
MRLEVRALALCAAVALAAPALAAEPAVRLTGINRRAGRLVVSVGVQDLIRPQDVPRLTSGFATRVLIQVVLVRLDTPAVVAQAFRHTAIVYDLWEEKFRVHMEANTPPEDRSVGQPGEALALATELRHFPVVELGRLEPGGTYQLRFRADLNPLSPDVVAEVRHWLVRPPAQGRLGPADSFFGSFVSIFVNPQIEESDRRIEFVSQPFGEPSQ